MWTRSGGRRVRVMFVARLTYRHLHELKVAMVLHAGLVRCCFDFLGPRRLLLRRCEPAVLSAPIADMVVSTA